MNVAIEYNCREWDYNAVCTALRMSSNDIADQIDMLYFICDTDKSVVPHDKSMLKNLQKKFSTLKKLNVVKPSDANNDKIKEVIACYVEITPQAIGSKPRLLKARRYLNLVHIEPLEEFDWSSE